MYSGEPLSHVRWTFAFDRWATRRILDAVDALPAEAFDRPLGGSFGSIRATLIHLAGADHLWLARWQGRSPSAVPELEAIATPGDLRTFWDGVHDARSGWLDTLSPDDPARVLSYRNTRGEPFEAPLWVLFRHVVNHASYHRGQVVHMIRTAGGTAPATDLVAYQRAAGAPE